MVEIRGLSKSFGPSPVLTDLEMHIGDGEFVSLVGPSGVGKTTLLRILADLDTPDSGLIRFNETPGRNRPVIMVFQDFALFPHMTTLENVAYGLKVRGIRKKQRLERAGRMLCHFGIPEKADEYPNRLSAGQRQRAAIARALILEPMVLLLDEPFANLDKNLKGETAEFIRSVQRSFNITTVMVTHDLDEAFAVSDRIGVMIDGVLKQFDTPRNLKSAPVDVQTARFIGQAFNLSDTEMIPRSS